MAVIFFLEELDSQALYISLRVNIIQKWTMRNEMVTRHKYEILFAATTCVEFIFPEETIEIFPFVKYNELNMRLIHSKFSFKHLNTFLSSYADDIVICVIRFWKIEVLNGKFLRVCETDTTEKTSDIHLIIADQENIFKSMRFLVKQMMNEEESINLKWFLMMEIKEIPTTCTLRITDGRGCSRFITNPAWISEVFNIFGP
ncbi:hypothetical protein YC2023_071308 [Brassica napus]